MNEENLTPAVKRIMEMAAIEASTDNYGISSRHIIIAMLLEGCNSMCHMLMASGFTVKGLRGEEINQPTTKGKIMSEPNQAASLPIPPDYVQCAKGNEILVWTNRLEAQLNDVLGRIEADSPASASLDIAFQLVSVIETIATLKCPVAANVGK